MNVGLQVRLIVISAVVLVILYVSWIGRFSNGMYIIILPVMALVVAILMEVVCKNNSTGSTNNNLVIEPLSISVENGIRPQVPDSRTDNPPKYRHSWRLSYFKRVKPNTSLGSRARNQSLNSLIGRSEDSSSQNPSVTSNTEIGSRQNSLVSTSNVLSEMGEVTLSEGPKIDPKLGDVSDPCSCMKSPSLTSLPTYEEALQCINKGFSVDE